MGLIDSHCHLHYDYLPKTHEDLVKEAKLAGVDFLITVGTDVQSIPAIQAISAQYDSVYHTVGIHPHDVSTVQDSDLEIVEKSAQNPKCKAIGEIGLDYYYEHSPKDIQQDKLKLQLDLASRLQLPVVIHSRDAEDDLLLALTSYAKGLPAGAIPGVIHCFSGTVRFGQACLDLGFYISFSGILTFKNAEEVRLAAKVFPLNRILVETDSPYLAPVPFRGKRCEPSMVVSTAQKVAEIRGIPFEEVVQKTSENTKKVFSIP